jgi:hypothetical protein
MKLKDIPIIRNIDKVHVYYKNYKVAHFWAKPDQGTYEQIRHHVANEILEQTPIDSMSIVLEGILADVIVLEIYLK